MRHLGDTNPVIVNRELPTILTVVADAVVVLVLAVRDDFHADLVVILDLVVFALLTATFCACVGIYCAVFDFRTANVVGDFDLVCLAVLAMACTLVVDTVVNCFDAHVFVLS